MKENIRDLSVAFFTDEIGIVTACDSSAAIGLKEADQVKVDPEITAAFCLRVALLEVLAVGGKPTMVIDTIGGEMEPTGKRMLKGLTAELKKAGLENVLINGSTEENMLTEMTSIGVTVIGSIHKAELNYGKVLSGSWLYQVGEPFMGSDVLMQEQEIFSYQDFYAIQKQAHVLEILPVGSKGVSYEAAKLAESSGLKVIFDQIQFMDSRSAGPATVLLVAVEENQPLQLTNQAIHIKKIGYFTEEDPS
ncbi:hypothetical protein A5821_000980 [Enterococcus sp. 7F3_DIV0205]|uniref:PurM-like N-terminal domain-containing protein n=1 Tax=Candidatus Enterococcus palustris TaxID=1834189 RepID=A0AAQ3WCL1_9ENTE|nr:AIR synthase related protein [Enterococcus sp. 7F3_DIV0205]OTN85377.1 hypothetical protein A5821_001323 [Enterococcus sp. 7F3_DIV0205]